MMCDAMSNEDFRFIRNIKDYMLDSTNMSKEESWNFAFRIWQSKEWLTRYLLNNARNDIVKVKGEE